MPSQEDYLDNLLKGIGNTEEEENSRKESEEGVKDETLQDPQIDMSDMDDLLQSALEAQQRDIPETQQSQNTQNSETIHPEETSSMSEDEIDRLLQQSREQAGSTEQQKEPDTNENDDLIKMLENVDDESLSNVLDQMAPNTENAEEPEKEEKRGKRKSFFDRFKKKKAKNSKNSAADETEYESLPEDMTEPDSGEPQTTADTQKMKDDDREALLPGAFPQTEDGEHTEQDNDGTDVMDILKAAGADIVDDASQKEEKKEKIPEVPEKKLSLKKVIPIVVVCISLGAVILLLSSFLTEYMTRRSGRKAYYAGDYQTCYQNFFGKELDETEQVMYSKSESILTIRMWLREYEVFVNEGSELEALDSLLQAVHDYPSLLNYATEYNAQDEVTVAFQEILNVLSQKYGLSQEEAQEIADISNNVEYTQRVMTVLQKLGLESWDMPQIVEDATPSNDGEEAAELPDPLPEEKEIQQ